MIDTLSAEGFCFLVEFLPVFCYGCSLQLINCDAIFAQRRPPIKMILPNDRSPPFPWNDGTGDEKSCAGTNLCRCTGARKPALYTEKVRPCPEVCLETPPEVLES